MIQQEHGREEHMIGKQDGMEYKNKEKGKEKNDLKQTRQQKEIKYSATEQRKVTQESRRFTTTLTITQRQVLLEKLSKS